MNREDVLPRYRPMYDRAMRGNSRMSAVRLNCLECSGWRPSEVRRRGISTCPFYLYRLSGKKGPPVGPKRNDGPDDSRQSTGAELDAKGYSQVGKTSTDGERGDGADTAEAPPPASVAG